MFFIYLRFIRSKRIVCHTHLVSALLLANVTFLIGIERTESNKVKWILIKVYRFSQRSTWVDKILAGMGTLGIHPRHWFCQVQKSTFTIFTGEQYTVQYWAYLFQQLFFLKLVEFLLHARQNSTGVWIFPEVIKLLRSLGIYQLINFPSIFTACCIPKQV